jgi:beta-galactosidase
MKRPSARSRTARPSATRSPVRFEGGALVLDGTPPRTIPFWSGAVHYFRAPRSAWRAQLAAARALGLPLVETYVPWQVHETAPGRFDFGGEGGDPDLDLGAFVDLAGELGLYVVLRPGPHINSEMTFFGLPERIVYDRACQARSPRQAPVYLGFPPRMFPVPSYASEAFFAEVDRWFAAAAEVIAPRLYPRGPVVLLQVDNEATYYFRDAAYDQDHHPDAIAQYRAFVAQRHPASADLARVHGAEDAAAVEPPTCFDVCGPDDGGDAAKLPRHLDWARFREELITTAIRRMKRAMEQVGLGGVPTIHNLPLGEMSAPVSLPALEGVVDAVGLDYYHARREHEVIVRRTQYLVGSSRLPISPEMGAGAPFWFTPLAHEDSLHCMMTTLAYGLRGMNLYMAVDRDRWYGAPVDADGRARPGSEEIAALLAALGRIEHHALERVCRAAILVPREYLRLARASHTTGFASPLWLEATGQSPVFTASDEPLGLDVAVQQRFWSLIESASAALRRANVPFTLIDSECDLERLEGLACLVVPSYEFAAPERWKLVTGFAARGGLVAFGPTAPRSDDTLRARPFEVPADALRFEADDAAALSEVVSELVRARPEIVSPARATAPVEVCLHERAGRVRAVWLVHPGGRAREVRVEGLPLGPNESLRDALGGRVHAVQDGAFTVELAPASVRLFEVLDGAANEAAAEESGG